MNTGYHIIKTERETSEVDFLRQVVVHTGLLYMFSVFLFCVVSYKLCTHKTHKHILHIYIYIYLYIYVCVCVCVCVCMLGGMLHMRAIEVLTFSITS